MFFRTLILLDTCTTRHLTSTWIIFNCSANCFDKNDWKVYKWMQKLLLTSMFWTCMLACCLMGFVSSLFIISLSCFACDWLPLAQTGWGILFAPQWKELSFFCVQKKNHKKTIKKFCLFNAGCWLCTHREKVHEPVDWQDRCWLHSEGNTLHKMGSPVAT